MLEDKKRCLRISRPDAWTDPPCEMSVSHLLEMEVCPRRWALEHADYSSLWQRRGYPQKLHLPALVGTVVHKASEAITRELIRAGCSSSIGVEAVTVMKNLGGYSSLLDRCIDQVLSTYTDNPRATHLIEMATRTLKSQIPSMRTQVQSLLQRVQLDTVFRSMSRHAGGEQTRHPLGPGIYPELEVRAPNLGWRGKIDILIVTESGCKIIDFKTGKARDHHRFQIQIYALLWNLDEDLNPARIPVKELMLTYGSTTIRIEGPSAAELDLLAKELLMRTDAAKTAVRAADPQARPGIESCRYCSVRHLCENYWNSEVIMQIGRSANDTSFFSDVELVISGRHGPASWDGVVVSSSHYAKSTPMILRMSASGPEFHSGQRIRLLDSHVTIPGEDGQPCVATPTALTEMFLVELENHRK